MFPNVIMTAPEVIIIAIEIKLADEIRKAVNASYIRVPLQYDTTFNLTGCYASILTMLHPFLMNKNGVMPPIPCAFLFHEKKNQEAHENFWRFMAQQLPELETKAFIVTDCEEGKIEI